MQQDVIDLNDVMDRVQDDKELLIELLDIFQEDYQIKRRQIRDAIESGQTEKVRDLAHSIKGASGNISARKMFACAEKIERLSSQGDIKEAAHLADDLDGYFEELQSCIEEIKKELNAGE